MQNLMWQHLSNWKTSQVAPGIDHGHKIGYISNNIVHSWQGELHRIKRI